MVDARILIIEDHGVVGSSFGAALERFEGLTVVGVETTLGGARERIARGAIDVIVADVEIGDYDTLGLPAEVGPTGPPVLYLSAHVEASTIRAAIDGGGAGYLSKDASLEEVANAIRDVASGGTSFSRSVVATARSAPVPPTSREREVLAGVVQGEPNKVIAARLGVGERTVESHVRRMFDRYAVDSRTALAMLAITERWVRR